MSGYYPICLSVSGKPCAVIGGGHLAERKVASLVAAAAKVTVISPALSLALDEMRDAGLIHHAARHYRRGDLAGMFLAVAATDDPVANERVAAEARAAHVLINVVDGAKHSDFTLPAVLRQGNVTVAISTGGLSPAVARYLRDRLADFITPSHAGLLDVAAAVRERYLRQGRRFPPEIWQAALGDDLVDLIAQRREAEVEALLVARLERDSHPPRKPSSPAS